MKQPTQASKFKVRKNHKLNLNILGDWVIIDPNGLLHEDGFYNKAHAEGICATYNIALANNHKLAYAF